MSGVDARPRSGARYVLERVDADDGSGTGAPTRAREPKASAEDGPGPTLYVLYRGFIHLPNADLPVEVRLELPSGTARASAGSGGDVDRSGTEGGDSAVDAGDRQTLLRAAAALVRSATKGWVAAGGALPRKIVRWRG